MSVEQAKEQEMSDLGKKWEEEHAKFDYHVHEVHSSLMARHVQEMNDLREQFVQKQKSPRFSKELLNLRRIQNHLVKQNQFAEAMQTKAKADTMEGKESSKHMGEEQSRFEQKKIQLLKRQEQEVKALEQKLRLASQENRKNRERDIEKVLKRYENIKRIVEQHQNILNAKTSALMNKLSHNPELKTSSALYTSMIQNSPHSTTSRPSSAAIRTSPKN